MSLALRVTQPAPASSEHDLVAAVRRGDDRAFEELYARYRSRIGSYIFGMVKDHGRAEDIAQEVFISALRRLRRTERTIIFKPWIYEIAKNACIDEYRRTRRIHEVPLEPDDDRESPVAALRSTSPTPDAAVESKQRLTDLRGAFRGLSESHHRILVLRELEGLSYNQIGARLGMTKPVVESTLFRARRRLGEEFEELESGRRCARVQSLILSDGERPLGSLGIREHRQFARHVAHCEPCLRQARDAGIDESLYRAPNLLGRIAVLAPIPWLRSLVPCFDPSNPGFGVGRAIATAAVVVAGAGAGGGLVLSMPRHPSRPPATVLGQATNAASAAQALTVTHRGDRFGAVFAVLGGAAGQGQSNPLAVSAAGTTPLFGLRVSSMAPRTQTPRLGSTSGTGPRPPAGGSPADPDGSGVPATNPTQGAAPASPSGVAGSATPSSGIPAVNLGQTGTATTGGGPQGLGSLPLTNGSLSGVAAGATNAIRSLPSLSPNGSGSATATATDDGTASPPSPAAASAASPALLSAAGQAAQALPNLGPAQSS
ncbi:MAG: sigma-70 family RNA polymerase sigma factor [Actinomycetota bacterium]|nr:sigma-70 family RNA polymerase sigma factor [Actinomycetota bacterium]